MTRSRLVVLIVAFAMSILPGCAFALEASDTMAAWKEASAAEKSKIVRELLQRDGRESAAAAVVKCLDAASGVAGHDVLPISELVDACAKGSGDPV